MKRQHYVVAGLLGTIGLWAFLGHRRQVREQELEATMLKEVRAFFEHMGAIEVLYVTDFVADRHYLAGGLVFADQGVITYEYKHGVMDYRLERG